MTNRSGTEHDAPMRGYALAITAVLVAGTIVAVGPVREAAAATTLADARVIFGRMSEAQRIGQLFMVGAGATGVNDATRAAITT